MDADQTRDAFRRWGYLQADIDPLDRLPKFPHRDLDTLSGAEVEKWRKLYCGKVGTEFMHIPFSERVDWLSERLEGNPDSVNRDYILRRLMSAKLFEQFIHTRYVGTKRFSLEGITILIPLLDSIVNRAADLGYEYVMLAMSHRGRLNVMYHIAGTSAANIFANFEDVDPKSVLGSGDVKYHKGATGTYRALSGKDIGVRLASNPSHLEAINPVIMGRTRARQERFDDVEEYKRVMCVLLHGDAAFAGQGITAEALNLADIKGFRIGGTVHVVVNNLIGFTAEPEALHSSRFASDIAKRLPIPIFHVNAESPDDAWRIGSMAVDYKKQFLSDVVIDLIGYRRYGHSEIDDPTYTSPLLYEKINSHPMVYKTYASQLKVADDEVKRLETEIHDALKTEQELGTKLTKAPSLFTLPDYWGPYCGGFYNPEFEVPTDITSSVAEHVGRTVSSYPEGFGIHPKLAKGLQQRLDMSLGNTAVDWGMAEALAFGSLLMENVPVRLSGQDSRRGTFSHRHAVFIDIHTGEEYIPLRHLGAGQARFDVFNSILSEAAVLGFEYGFSRDYPEALVLWEAQFGDFANGAQIIIDQFLTAAEDKWGLLSGLVMLLPHGYEGQGPEHTSARLERYLQVAGEDNIQVAYPSTASQYFHLLRRQALRRWRKPLIVFTPKSMLRATQSSSPLSEFTAGHFRNVLDHSEAEPSAVQRILFCSGKIAHQLSQKRAQLEDSTSAVVSIEQLYPFPEDEVTKIFAKYSNATSVVWVQEECANMGALFFVKPLIQRLAGNRNVSTVKRSASASPATGSAKAHAIEQESLINLAFARFQ